MNMSDRKARLPSRRDIVANAASLFWAWPIAAQSATTKSLDERFDFLSANSNSSCSGQFLDSIATMPDGARLQGSCCSPMERNRYKTQVNGLKNHAAVPEIPPDPYDIDAKLAARMLTNYDLVLSPDKAKAYDYAMEHSEEKGPCCCRCWRWKVYGGLAKLLISEHSYTGEQVTEVWNLSDGCGGES